MKIMYAISNKAVAELIGEVGNIVETILNPVPSIVETMKQKNYGTLYLKNPEYSLGIVRLGEVDAFVNIGENKVSVHPLISYIAYSMFRNPGDNNVSSTIKDIEASCISVPGGK